jgi:hypothetical protein
MGLDMYLSKKTYVKQWSHREAKEQFHVTVKKGTKKFDEIKTERVSYVVEEVGYWRKFNALHEWFVQNCQGGIDDCRESSVSSEQIVEILEICKKVQTSLLSSPKNTVSIKIGMGPDGDIMDDIQVFSDTSVAEELLPTQPGFFFGGTEYDEWYMENLSNTIELFEGLVSEDPEGYAEYSYHSSW